MIEIIYQMGAIMEKKIGILQKENVTGELLRDLLALGSGWFWVC